jgi:hypothetical protein
VTSRETYGSQWQIYTYVGPLVGYIARSSQPGDQTSLDAMALDTRLLPHHIKNDLLGQCQDASRFCGWQQSHSQLRRPSTGSTECTDYEMIVHSIYTPSKPVPLSLPLLLPNSNISSHCVTAMGHHETPTPTEHGGQRAETHNKGEKPP